MFKDDYKNSFKDINPKKSLQNEIKEKMILEAERKNNNVFLSKKLVYGLSIALVMLILGRLYIPKNFSKDENLEFSMESQTDENGFLDIGEDTENGVSQNNARKENSEIGMYDFNKSEYILEDFNLSEEEKGIEFSKVEINNTVTSLALDFKDETVDKVLTYEEYQNYLGVDFLPKYLPDGFEIKTSLDEMKILNIFYKDGRVAYDPALISYADTSDIEKLKNIDLTVSKIDYLPTADLSFHYIGDLKEEIINNQKVYLGYDILLSDKFHSKEEIEEMNKNDEHSLYLAKFEKNGVYYKLISSFLEKEEFLKVLKSLI